MIFILKNKDIKVAIFELTSLVSSTDLQVKRVLVDTVPYFLRTNITFLSWLQSRVSPISRRNMINLFKFANIDNLQDYCLISKAVSLNDTFWVDTEKSGLFWSKISPYKCSFNSTLSLLSWGMFKPLDTKCFESPEFSTDGNSKKCWQRIDGEIRLLKSEGSFGELEYSNVYSEYFATQLCEFLGLRSFVKYSLRMKRGELASSCVLFTSETFGFVPIGDLFSSLDCGTLELDLKRFKELKVGQYVYDVYHEMLLLDSLIFNIDRHEGNYGFIINNDTQKLNTIAPIFDYDRSLFYNIGLVNRDLQDIAEDLRGLKPRTLQGSFEEQGYLCVRSSKELQQKILNVYKNFSFVNSKEFPCSQERVDMLSKIVRQQAGRILSMCKKNNSLLV